MYPNPPQTEMKEKLNQLKAKGENLFLDRE